MLKHSPFEAEHQAAGATFTDFNGWNMPLKYGKELDEHRAVRSAAGLFDVSHMGKIWITGPDAATGLNLALAGNFAPMSIGRARYTLALTDEGTILDDLIVYRFGDDRFLAIPNAGNAAVILEALQERLAGLDVSIEDETEAFGLLALQGPRSLDVLQALPNPALAEHGAELKNYTGVELTIDGAPVILARTGYTGEFGFEIIVPTARASALWNDLMAAGEPLGMLPCGLAARDSLRLEAGMPLYGNELTTTVTPFEARLDGVVSFKKTEDFVGRRALEASDNPERVLVGLVSEQRRAGRAGADLIVDGERVGTITSGIPSPTLGYPIAMGYIQSEHAAPGTNVDVDVRGKALPFTIVALPFYSRPK